MKILPIQDKHQWKEWMQHCREIDFQQTWEYGNGVKNHAEWEPVRQAVFDGEQPIALAQTLTKTLPVLGRVARMQNGPMFIDCEPRIFHEQAIAAIQTLKQYWTEEQQSVLHFTPCLYPHELPAYWEQELGLQETNEPIWASIRIDLHQEPDTIRKRMRRTGWREPLRKAEKMGLKSVWSQNPGDFHYVLDRYEASQAAMGFSWPSVELVRSMWEEASDSFHIIFAEKENTRVAAMAVFTFASISYCLIAWNPPDSREFHAVNFIFWQSILHFRELGYRWLDVGGIDPVNLPGITKFKRGMRGEEYQWAGNYEAYPADLSPRSEHVSRFENMSHIIPGLQIPQEGKQPLRIVEDVENIIDQFLQDSIGVTDSVDRNQSLVNSGLIDSLSIVSLVQTLQETFNIEIAPFELTIEHFDSIQKISDFVSRKCEP